MYFWPISRPPLWGARISQWLFGRGLRLLGPEYATLRIKSPPASVRRALVIRPLAACIYQVFWASGRLGNGSAATSRYLRCGRAFRAVPSSQVPLIATSFIRPTSLTTPNGLRLPGQQNRNVAFDPNKHHWKSRWMVRYIGNTFRWCSFSHPLIPEFSVLPNSRPVQLVTVFSSLPQASRLYTT